jgi:putative endonuclease
MKFLNKPFAVNSSEIGQQAEQQAMLWLSRHNLKLVERNYHSPFGEIDLIMREAAALIFIEVRYRQYNSFGGAAESVTHSKQQKIRKTAQHFLSQNPKLASQACRFDVMAAQPGASSATLCFTWIKNAF